MLPYLENFIENRIEAFFRVCDFKNFIKFSIRPRFMLHNLNLILEMSNVSVRFLRKIAYNVK